MNNVLESQNENKKNNQYKFQNYSPNTTKKSIFIVNKVIKKEKDLNLLKISPVKNYKNSFTNFKKLNDSTMNNIKNYSKFDDQESSFSQLNNINLDNHNINISEINNLNNRSKHSYQSKNDYHINSYYLKNSSTKSLIKIEDPDKSSGKYFDQNFLKLNDSIDSFEDHPDELILVKNTKSSVDFTNCEGFFSEVFSSHSNNEPPLQEKNFKNGRWNKQEHELFCKALLQSSNDWSKVKGYIKTRTSSQIRSHAQKFFIKLKASNIFNYDLVNFEVSKLKLTYPELFKKDDSNYESFENDIFNGSKHFTSTNNMTYKANIMLITISHHIFGRSIPIFIKDLQICNKDYCILLTKLNKLTSDVYDKVNRVKEIMEDDILGGKLLNWMIDIGDINDENKNKKEVSSVVDNIFNNAFGFFKSLLTKDIINKYQKVEFGKNEEKSQISSKIISHCFNNIIQPVEILNYSNIQLFELLDIVYYIETLINKRIDLSYLLELMIYFNIVGSKTTKKGHYLKKKNLNNKEKDTSDIDTSYCKKIFNVKTVPKNIPLKSSINLSNPQHKSTTNQVPQNIFNINININGQILENSLTPYLNHISSQINNLAVKTNSHLDLGQINLQRTNNFENCSRRTSTVHRSSSSLNFFNEPSK